MDMISIIMYMTHTKLRDRMFEMFITDNDEKERLQITEKQLLREYPVKIFV